MNCNDRQFLGLDQATQMALSRRTFIKGSAGGIGLAALGSLIGTPAFAANPGLGFPNFKPKAKRIVYLFQSGAPSQMDLFDPKPQLEAMRGKDLTFRHASTDTAAHRFISVADKAADMLVLGNLTLRFNHA